MTTELLKRSSAALALLFCMSCNSSRQDPGHEYMPDMYRSQSYQAYEENPSQPGTTTALTPPQGTVARGYTVWPYPATPEGYELAGTEWKNPLEATPQNVDEGQVLFLSFCAVCHGESGDGNGSLVRNGKFPQVPSYRGQLRDLPEGKMFHSITYGKNLMGAHASLLSYEERCKVILYIKKLQSDGL